MLQILTSENSKLTCSCVFANPPPGVAFRTEGATTWLSKLGLGITPTAPGYARWEAVPQLLGPAAGVRGLSMVRGSVPTPHGVIEFSYDASGASAVNATNTLVVTVPAGTVAVRVALPAFGVGIAELRLVSARPLTSSLATAVTSGSQLLYTNASSSSLTTPSPPPRPSSAPSSSPPPSARINVAVAGDGDGAGDVALYLTELAAGQYEFAFEFVSALPAEADTAATTRPAPSNGSSNGNRTSSGGGGGGGDGNAVAASSGGPNDIWDPSNTDFTYAAQYRGMDTSTSGDWKGKYGSAGYVLFNYTSAGPDAQDRNQTAAATAAAVAWGAGGGKSVDAVKLPDYITGVFASDPPPTGGPPFPKGRDGRHVAVVTWDSSTSDPRALESPGSSGPRTAAAVSSQGWASFHIDVEAAPSAPAYNVTLYMVDYDSDFVRLGIKVRDGTSLKTIAPMVYVEMHAGPRGGAPT